MKREEIIEKLKQAEPALRAAGVAGLYLFGSIARGEARADSDIDIFIDPLADDRFGFLQYMEVYETIKRAVGKQEDVSYSTRGELSPHVRGAVEKEAIRVF